MARDGRNTSNLQKFLDDVKKADYSFGAQLTEEEWI
jgi:hypothetical protein